MKVWLLTNTPSPYQLDFFSAIAESTRCEIHVRFMSRLHNGTDPLSSLKHPFSYQILNEGLGAGARQEFHYYHTAVKELRDPSYDVFILSGLYTSVTFLACAWRLIELNRPWIIWLEQPWPEGYSPPWATRLTASHSWIRTLRNGLLKRLLTSAHLTFCIGTAAVSAYTRLGAPTTRLVNLPYHCDTHRFQSKERRTAVRHCLHVDNHVVFLYSGSLIPRKGCDLLVSTFIRIANDHTNTTLLLLGSGSSRTELESMVPESLKSRVRFLGHREQDEIPDVYQASDVFVFPSRHDGWGVVLNEAAAAGLPIIATESTGAALDLVHPGRNGFRIPRDDEESLYKAMTFFIEKPSMITTMGEESSMAIESLTLVNGVCRFCDALEGILSHRRS